MVSSRLGLFLATNVEQPQKTTDCCLEKYPQNIN